MNIIKLREILAQASDNEAVELLQQTLRQSVRMALYDAMEQEVNLLCGRCHSDLSLYPPSPQKPQYRQPLQPHTTPGSPDHADNK